MRVVILGGGYAAVWCYRALRRRLGPRVGITVVAPFADHVFHGFTAEVLDGDLAPGLQTSPLRECLRHARLVRGWATRVDPDLRTVEVVGDDGMLTVPYDELVVATGAHDRTDPVPGMAEHGWTLRFPGQVEALLEHLDALAATPAPSAGEARRRSTVVVVGAGFAGTEVAAGLGRRFGTARRIVLVASTDTVVPTWRDRSGLQDQLRENLDAAGVEVLTGVRVVRVDADGVTLSNGVRIGTATVVATLGNRVPGMPGLEAHQEADGQLVVDDDLRVADGVWSAGDVAAMRGPEGRAPKEALWAIRAGALVGANIARTAAGRRPRPYRFGGLGSVASFAPWRSVAELRGVPLPGAVGWAVRMALFLWFMPSRRTALLIVLAAVRPRRQRPVAAPIPVAAWERVKVPTAA